MESPFSPRELSPTTIAGFTVKQSSRGGAGSRLSSLSISKRLALIVLALAIPLNLVIIAAVWRLSEEASETQRASLLYTARALAAAVDLKIGQYIALGEALSRSPSLLDGDLAGFEVEARRAFTSIPDATILVADLNGQQLLNTGARRGQKLPVRTVAAFKAQTQALERGAPVISGVRQGLVSQTWVLTVEIPVFKDGRPLRSLAIAVKAEAFLRILNGQNLPENWLAGMIDAEGKYIARAMHGAGDQATGQLASESWRRIQDRDGVHEILTFEGEPVVKANISSGVTGWSIGVALKKSILRAAAWHTARWALILGGLISILSLVCASAVARTVAAPIGELCSKAQALFLRPESALAPAGPPEVKKLWRALKQAATDRSRSEEALRDSEERLRLANEAADIGTFTVDVRGGRANYSPELAAMIGFPDIRTINMDDAFARVHRDDVANARAKLEAGLSGADGGQIRGDFRFVRPGGEIRWMAWAGRVVFSEGPSGRVPERIFGACVDITERKRHEEQVELLLKEVNHRSKNMLAVVQAIARQTAATKPSDFVERFIDRVGALSASQDLLTQSEWKGVDLDDLIQSQLAHFQDLTGSRILVDGPKLLINPAAAQSIGMAVHELATNAGKYGALSDSAGQVGISWHIQRSRCGHETFSIEWRETGGPEVCVDERQGFGTAVTTGIIESSLDGKAQLAFEKSGLKWRFECPAAEVLAQTSLV